ncbi:hypothetical protein CG478_002730 [Bacillus cytotoxicus]|uniref:hypothetical protein n=2 Tax=Bacillus cytotoxicus TaxID=580165 RepID=UPI000863D594|nr:hypothetical protein [Bacillus cytotoxicus]AWC29072.1 hypothetical protein CG483_012520 [Bacillus cytotoxicus]AWC39542.1 hypothetical protein CG480_002730 [Bacillus cytotoxicus]AWC47473.1 hypothetical protein CG478_002730 [Bacillus cytotoxicus]AWC53143.1 hypothetical protein CG477_012480 [Bacillus cytotoxicus]AWC57272.1 hypothetical protein CG476_012505 [Bacillus cytotoxicus]
MTTLESKRLSIKEYHIMLTGYRERLLDTYEIASVQALFNRNAQSEKVKSLEDIFKRPENARLVEAQEEHKKLTKKIKANESLFDAIEQALRNQNGKGGE